MTNEQKETDLEKLLSRFPDKPWDWDSLSRNPNIIFEHVLANPDKPWNWSYLSRNPNVTIENVLANPYKPWNWISLSRNPNITFEHVLAHPDKPWDWGGLSGNKFRKHEKFKNALPFISAERKAFLAELVYYFWIPPGTVEKRKIFANGGVRCQEAFRESTCD